MMLWNVQKSEQKHLFPSQVTISFSGYSYRKVEESFIGIEKGTGLLIIQKAYNTFGFKGKMHPLFWDHM